jgi:hypothetical protein
VRLANLVLPRLRLLHDQRPRSVRLNSGFVYPQTIRCSNACSRKVRVFRARGPHVALTETLYKGWKFAGWSGSCKSKKRTCAIDLSRVTPSPPGGVRFAKVTPDSSGSPDLLAEVDHLGIGRLTEIVPVRRVGRGIARGLIRWQGRPRTVS